MRVRVRVHGAIRAVIQAAEVGGARQLVPE
jgi:hypothetical protein